MSDNYTATGSGSGFALGSGINSGINPPTTRLTGSAATNLRYLCTDTSKAATAYTISANKVAIASSANPGRFVLSANGTTPFDFGPSLGIAAASPTNPAVYDVNISIKNSSSGTTRCSFAIGTTEGINTVWDFGFQLYKTASADTFYTVADRIDSASSGLVDFTGTILTMTAGSFGFESNFVMRVTDAGAETTTFNSRIQLSMNAGVTWFYDTATDPNLPNGFRFDAATRLIMWDIAGSTAATYDNFSINTIVTPSRFWSGLGADDNWSTGANWNGTAPSSGEALTFNGTTRQNNTNDLNGLTVPWVALNNGGFSLFGNTFTNSGAITNVAGTNTLNGEVAWTSTTAKTWSLASGSELVLNNTNTIEVAGDHSVVGGGTLRLIKAVNIGQTAAVTPVFNIKEGTHIVEGGTFRSRGDYRIGSLATGTGARTILTNGALLNLTVSGANLRVGDSANPVTSQLLIDNSTVTLLGNLSLPNAANATGAVMQVGGTVSGGTLNFSQNGAGTGTYSVTNGTLEPKQIKKTTAGGVAQIYFHNAILRTAAGASSAFFSGLNLAEIQSGGLTLDATVDVVVDQVLSGVGAFAKNNTASVSLNGNNTFGGGATLNAGTLSLGHDSALGTGAVTLNGGALTGIGGARVVTNSVSVGGDISVGGANTLTLSGSVDFGGTARVVTVTNSSDTIFSGAVSGTGGLTKTGTGTLVLTADNSAGLSGNVTISAGTVKVSNTTGLATGTGNLIVSSGGTLQGTGIVGPLTLSGAIAAGNSVGTITTGSQIWNGGATNKVEIIDVASTTGTGWDFVDLGAGTLTINASDVAPVKIDVASLAAGSVPGALAVFDNTATYSWVIARANGGISGFSQDKFQVLTGNFVNSLGAGSFGVFTNGNTELVLTFAVAPSITTHPVNVTVTTGGAANFSVEASGVNALTYQWRKNGTPVAGATNTLLSFNPVVAGDAATYSVRVFSIDGFATSSNAVLSIPPSISVQPLSTTNEIGTSASFNVTADGQAPLIYQWRKDGVNIVGATADSFAINPVFGTNAATYTVVITNAAGSITSDAAILSTPPELVSSPTNITTSADYANLAFLASGSPVLEHHWRKLTASDTNEIVVDEVKYFAVTNVSGVTLTITNLAVSDDGNYDVVVSNSFGAKTSAVAVVKYQSLPVIVTNPTSVTNNAGQTAVFTVTAGGVGPLSYQWNKVGSGSLTDGGTISGANTAALTILGVVQADAGSYYATVTNINASVDSATATLTVIDPPVITLAPANTSVGAGSNALFTVGYSGSTAAVQWKKNGSNLAESGRVIGVTTTTLTIAGVTQADADSYSVVIANAAGTVSNSASLLVFDPPVITLSPVSATRATGTNVTFAIAASGTSLSCEWKKVSGGSTNTVANDIRISGATTTTLTIDNLSSADDGDYYAVASNLAGTASSGSASLAVFDSLTITVPPQSLTVINGNSATFNVTAIGGGTLGYQWKRAGTNLIDDATFSGVNSSSLTVSNVLAADATNYFVVVTNQVSSATSADATLTVIDPYISANPVSVIKGAGSNAVFSVTAIGTEALTYQWKKGATSLADLPGHIVGATSANLTIVGISSTDADSYSVEVANALSSVISSASASLTVIDPPVVIGNLANTNGIEGGSAGFTVSVAGTSPLTYHWTKDNVVLTDGVHISGATTEALTLTGLTVADAGVYAVSVTNFAGSTSSSASLSVTEAPIIATQPVSVTNNAGTTAIFNVDVTGAGVTYLWKKDGVSLVDGGKISGATTASLTITNVLKADQTNYSVTVSNIAGTANSDAVMLTVNDPAIVLSPVNTIVNLSNVTSLSVSAAGSGTLKYAWYFKTPTATTFAVQAGKTNATLLITNALAIQSGSYYAIVTNIYGKATSATATLTVIVPPKIVSQPTLLPKASVPNGTMVTFSVPAATGTAPSYQWYLNNIAIPGATLSKYTNAAATFSDVGNYTVILSNGAGSATNTNTLSLAVTNDMILPTVSITKPAAVSINLATTNPTAAVTAYGLAADNARVTNVFYRLNGSAWTPVSNFVAAVNGLTAKWTNELTVAAGTNILEAYSADYSGTNSKISKTVFFYHVPSTLTVSIDEHDTRGDEGSHSAWGPDYKGTLVAPTLVIAPIAAPTNGATLYVNRGPYKLTAIAGHNQMFTNWTRVDDGVTNFFSTNAAVTFAMETNLHLVANFVHNPWMEAAGEYSGLFTNSGVDFENSGFINLTVGTNRTFSGKLLIDGDNLPLSGSFNIDGTRNLTVSRALKGKTNLFVGLKALFGADVTSGSTSGTNQIVGNLTNGAVAANILADQWVYKGALTNPYVGKYTLILPKGLDAATSPGGYGYGLITVATNAKALVTGALADSTPFLPEIAAMSLDGRWPVFKQIYLAGKLRTVNFTNDQKFHTNVNNLGAYIGWLQFTSNSSIGGELKWIKTTKEPTNLLTSPIGVYTNYYTNGFTNLMAVNGFSYTTPTGADLRVIQVTNALISFGEGNLTSLETQQIRMTTNNIIKFITNFNLVTMTNQLGTKVTNSHLGALTVNFDKLSGKMSGTFTNGISLLPTGGAKPILWSGAVLQPWNIGYGYFLGTNQSGAVMLQQSPGNIAP